MRNPLGLTKILWLIRYDLKVDKGKMAWIVIQSLFNS